MKASVSPFTRIAPGDHGGTEVYWTNVQPLQSYPARTSPLERGDE